MEFNRIDNKEFYDTNHYSLNLTEKYGRTGTYTPQINGISLMMPPVPVLYQWDQIPKVEKI